MDWESERYLLHDVNSKHDHLAYGLLSPPLCLGSVEEANLFLIIHFLSFHVLSIHKVFLPGDYVWHTW